VVSTHVSVLDRLKAGGLASAIFNRTDMDLSVVGKPLI